MTISSVSFMGKENDITSQKKTKKKKDKKSKQSFDVKILTDNNGKVIIKAKDDFLKIRVDNRNNKLNGMPEEDTFILSKGEQKSDKSVSNKEEKGIVAQPKQQTKAETKAEETEKNEKAAVQKVKEQEKEEINKQQPEKNSGEKIEKSEKEVQKPQTETNNKDKVDKNEQTDNKTVTKEEQTPEESEIEKEEKAFFKGVLQDLRKEIAPKAARLIIAVCTVGLSSLGIKVGTDKLDEMPDTKYVMYDDKTSNLENVSATYNIDEDILLYINDIDNKTDLNNVNRLKIPSTFDYLKESTQEITKNIYKSKNEEETKRLGEELDKIKEKREAQKELASMYTDGEFVYICLNDFAKNPSLAKKYDGLSISVDKIQKLFDIKNGALKRYNTIDNMGYKLDENNQKVFAEFTYPVVPSGTILKVKKDAINIKTPNLDDYTKTEPAKIANIPNKNKAAAEESKEVK